MDTKKNKQTNRQINKQRNKPDKLANKQNKIQQTRNTKIRQMEHKNIKRQQIMTDAKAKSKLT